MATTVTKRPDAFVYGGHGGSVMHAAMRKLELGPTARVILGTQSKHLGGVFRGLGSADYGRYGDEFLKGLTGLMYELNARSKGSLDSQERWEPSTADIHFRHILELAGVEIITNMYLLPGTAKFDPSDATKLVEQAFQIGATGKTIKIRTRHWAGDNYEGDFARSLVAEVPIAQCVAEGPLGVKSGSESRAAYDEFYGGFGGGVQNGPHPYHDDGSLIAGVVALPNGLQVGDAHEYIMASGFREAIALNDAGGNGRPWVLPTPGSARSKAAEYGFRDAKGSTNSTYNPGSQVGHGIFSDQGGIPSLSRAWARAPWFPSNRNPNSDEPHRGCGPDGAWPKSLWQLYRDAKSGMLARRAVDPESPRAMRESLKRFGYPRDIFVANGGQTEQLYVREAWNIRSAAVLSQLDTDCLPGQITTRIMSGGKVVGSGRGDWLGCATYSKDLFSSFAFPAPGSTPGDGSRSFVETTAGGAAAGSPPEVIGTETIPMLVGLSQVCLDRTQITNWLTTWGVSCTHVAWGAIRIELTMMVIGMASGIAAAKAQMDGVAYQDVDMDWVHNRMDFYGINVAPSSWPSDWRTQITRYAKGTATIMSVPINQQNITIAGVQFRYVTSPSGNTQMAVPTTTAETQASLWAAIQGILAAPSDPNYAALNAMTWANDAGAGVITFTAKKAGAAGNRIPIAKSGEWVRISGATLSGGLTADKIY